MLRHDSSLDFSACLFKLAHPQQRTRRQYLFELLIMSHVLAVILSLIEAGHWSALSLSLFIRNALYLHWLVFSLAAVMDVVRAKKTKLKDHMLYLLFFCVLQGMLIMATVSINLLYFWGQYFSFYQLSWSLVVQNLDLNLSYGVLFGGLCLRYLYVREQWLCARAAEQAIRAQAMQKLIHPHFIFNSMNTVVCLISSDPEKAEQLLIDFSILFRASLQQPILLSLENEIKLCQHYLAIEQVRLGSKLQVEWKIQHNGDLSRAQIPLLTLQPLLENSIFHGVEQHIDAAKISVLVELFRNQVTIVITNPSLQDKMKIREGQGIALATIRQRLLVHFGSDAKFRQYTSKGMYVTFIQYQY